MNTITTLTWLTFHEARRRRMVLAGLGMGIVLILLYSIGLVLINNELNDEGAPLVIRQQAYNFLLMAGLYVVHFLTIMLAIFASVDTVSGEIASHTIQALVTKPVQRWQVLLGKWLGYALMLVLYLMLLAGGIMLAMYLLVGYWPDNALQGLLLLALEALVLLSLSMLGGTRFATLTNGVLLFMLYGLAFIGGWVEQVGALLRSESAINIGIIASLLLPVEALWRLASSLMQPATSSALPTPFSTASVPSGAMVVYAIGYAAVALCLAMYTFSKRDL
ncbi:MAG: hypothetical protein OHK0022_59880 [Roseiflexaceae bacterium]